MEDLTNIIAGEIRARGRIPFARFMELALYAPALGYYERELEQIGRRGDFFTSVSVGPLFGQLLAFQFARWIEPEPSPVQIVEVAAHDGQLAEDILASLQAEEHALWPRLEYWIVEPSRARQAVQKRRLDGWGRVRWCDDLSELQSRVRGVVFSNELLDSLPVHPLRWNATEHRWQEVAVGLAKDQLVFELLPECTVPVPSFPEELLCVLPHGYTYEVSPAAQGWWRSAAGTLISGHLLAIDYGGAVEELLNPGRLDGTLRAYTHHRVSTDLLADPGEQDLTAHVNFSEVQRTGEAAGLVTETFTSQSNFLTAIARRIWERRGAWPMNAVRQFQTLTHPEHLGRPFRVLVQARNPSSTITAPT